MLPAGCNRHCQRIVPADEVCRLTVAGLKEGAGRVCAAFAKGLPAKLCEDQLRFAGVPTEAAKLPTRQPGSAGALCNLTRTRWCLPDVTPASHLQSSRPLDLVVLAQNAIGAVVL